MAHLEVSVSNLLTLSNDNITCDLKLTDITPDARVRCVAICYHYASGPGRDIGPRSVRASAPGPGHTGGGSRGPCVVNTLVITW